LIALKLNSASQATPKPSLLTVIVIIPWRKDFKRFIRLYLNIKKDSPSGNESLLFSYLIAFYLIAFYLIAFYLIALLS